MKSDQVIALEIATLAELSRLVPQLTDCGLPDVSGHVIATQIEVLAKRLDSHQVHQVYSGCADALFLTALQASDWAHDLLSPEYDEAPSLEWRDVVKYEAGAEGVDERARAALERARNSGVRCHGDACAAGQKPCPSPLACGVEGGAA